MKMRVLPLLVLPLILSCAFACPAPAGEEEQSVTLFSDRKGDGGWIEMDRSAGRMRATPYLRVSGETVRRAVDTTGRAGEARGPAASDTRKPDQTVMTDRKTRRKEALASLLEGPGGVSLGRVLDIARQTSESAGNAVRQAGAGMTNPPRQGTSR